MVYTMLCNLGLGIVAMILHESAHAMMAELLGVEVKRVLLCYRGVAIVREPGACFDNIVISLAGPVLNLVVALVLWPLLPTFALANLIMGVVNLLPMKHTDGDRVLDCIDTMKQIRHKRMCAEHYYNGAKR